MAMKTPSATMLVSNKMKPIVPLISLTPAMTSDARPADERAADQPAIEVQVLRDQTPHHRAAHSPRSFRLCMTVATKISSSVMRCTSRTVAPACS